jgi:beta-glucosidase
LKADDARFPAGFLWGAATSAYQIEGSPLADGAGASIWHRFSHTPGRVFENQTGDVACDHYHRFEEDIEWMRRLGLTAYRMSISWSRVLPGGYGRVNPAGLDFYARLVDLLLANGITPMVTLYHWDLPAALDDRGGWTNPVVADWFANYALVMFGALGDRVPLWATINEPWVIVDGGYLHGALAPGHRSLFEPPLAAHNVLRAHGAAVRAFRSGPWSAAGAKIGIVLNFEPKDPATDRPEDVAAAKRADAQFNRHYIDALFRGRYPDDMAEIYGEGWPSFPAEDFALIQEPMDFMGINYYSRGLTVADDEAWPTRASKVINPDAEYTALNWEVYPQGLRRTLSWVKERVGDLPLYVTENGAAFEEPLAVSGGLLADPRRMAYLSEHILAVRAAIAEGVDVRGYFAWSLLDNMEWSHGYATRFGLLHVDFASQKRTPKGSALYFREIVRTNGAVLAEATPEVEALPALPS